MPTQINIAGIIIPGEWLRAAIIFGSFLAAALLIGLFWRKIVSAWVAKSESTLDDKVARAVRSLVVWGLILGGAHAALTEVATTQLDTQTWPILARVLIVAWIMLAVVTTIRVFGAIAAWKVEQAAHIGPEAVRETATRVNLFKKLMTAVIFGLGAIYALSVAGIDTAPILAGGAISGVVIGIALQDTLSNVFAGIFMNIDRPVKIGDYIGLESGQEGFVESIGWRYTKVRLFSNNLLIIPNNKLSTGIITNFNLPAEPFSIYVKCGVAYDSDLEAVERVAIDIARKVMANDEFGDRSWEPVVRYKEFGESSISFVTILRALDVNAQFRIQHEFMKQLHSAFAEHKIEIPFPVRTVIIKREPGES